MKVVSGPRATEANDDTGHHVKRDRVVSACQSRHIAKPGHVSASNAAAHVPDFRTIAPKKEALSPLCACGEEPLYYSHGKWTCAACWAATQGRVGLTDEELTKVEWPDGCLPTLTRRVLWASLRHARQNLALAEAELEACRKRIHFQREELDRLYREKMAP